MKSIMTFIGQDISQPESSLDGISNHDFAAIIPVISGLISGRETNMVNRVTFYREGYQFPCSQPIERFMKEFVEVKQ